MEVLALLTSLQNIVILSIIVIVLSVSKAQMLYVHIMGYTTFVSLQFFSKTGFVDIVPLCCKPSILPFTLTELYESLLHKCI